MSEKSGDRDDRGENGARAGENRLRIVTLFLSETRQVGGESQVKLI
jgi:hypothetical protein